MRLSQIDYACDSCESKASPVVEVDVCNLQTICVWLCESCLRKALALFNAPGVEE